MLLFLGDTCWAHATKKNIEARLKINFGLDVTLSVEHLYHGIDKKMTKDAIKDFDELKSFLKNEGVIQEKDCECEKRTNKKDPCSKKIKVKSKYSNRVMIGLVIQTNVY